MARDIHTWVYKGVEGAQNERCHEWEEEEQLAHCDENIHLPEKYPTKGDSMLEWIRDPPTKGKEASCKLEKEWKASDKKV